MICVCIGFSICDSVSAQTKGETRAGAAKKNGQKKAKPAGQKRRPAKLTGSAEVSQTLNVVYSTQGDRALKVDIFRPKSDHVLPAVLVVHGGGWLKGDKTKFHAMAEALAMRGFVAVAVEYRLGGEAKFPAAVIDCVNATKFIRANAKKYGVDPKRIGAVGGSAGAHLVGLMATASGKKEFQDALPDVSGQIQSAVMLAGPMDLTSGSVAKRSRENPNQSNSNKWIGKTIDEAPQLYALGSPIKHATKSSPPMFFMRGEFDKPLADASMQKKLAELSVHSELMIYKNAKHACWNLHPWFDIMVDDIDSFLSKTLNYEKRKNEMTLLSGDWGKIIRNSEGTFAVIEKPADTKKVVKMPRLDTRIGKTDEVKFTPNLVDWSIRFNKPNVASPYKIKLLDHATLFENPRVAHECKSVIELPAHYSETFGELLRFEPQPHKNTVGYWANAEDYCQWNFFNEKPGKFTVKIFQGCGTGQGGSSVDVLIGKEKINFTVEDTGHFQNFKWRELGTVEIPAGIQLLQLKVVNKAKNAVMDVRKMELIRVEN